MRRFLWNLVSFAFFIAWCLAVPTSVPHVVHEKREFTSPKWVKRGRLHPESTFTVRIGLTQSNLHLAHGYLMDVAHPASLKYGKHWTAQQVKDVFAPSKDTTAAVADWLSSSGITKGRIHRSHNKGWLAFNATVKEAESLLRAVYHVFEDTTTGETAAACEAYHVPEAVREHIDYITPGIKLLATGPKRKGKRSIDRGASPAPHIPGGPPGLVAFPPQLYGVSESDLDHCDEAITPACVKALYHVPNATKADLRNPIGIFEEGDIYSQEDLDRFFGNYTPYIPQGTHPIPAFIDGAQAPNPVLEGGGESALDFQLAYPLIYPQQIELFQTDDAYYTTGNSNSTGLYNTWLDGIDGSYCTYSAYGETGNDPIDPVYPDSQPGGYDGPLQCGAYEPTNVMSVSYSQQEFDRPVYYQLRQCNEFMKLALQGHTIFFSSGDTGVAGRPGYPPPNGCLGSNHTIFNPRWPDSCPYLTVVGATKVSDGKTVFDPETAANDPSGSPFIPGYSTGGGFSNIHAIPEYQATAVAHYFSSYLPPYPYYSGNEPLGANGGLYNRSGRGYPDVSANGDNIVVYRQGARHLSGGTSASTPIFASIVNLINEERLAVGKSPVGFINPVLYENPQVLNDITDGSNPGCGTNGFSAVPGWDPLTGLGTPNYPKMLDLFLSLP